jgi:hypothetical protein
MSRDANEQLKKQIGNQDTTIKQMARRQSDLNDKVALLQTEVDIFKDHVKDDIKKIVDFLNTVVVK